VKSRRPASAVLLAALSLLVSGCAVDETELARVGTRTLTVAEFNEIASRFAPNYTLPPDSAKRRLLEDLVSRIIVAEHARAAGLDHEPGFAIAVQRAALPLLTEALFRDQVGGPLRVSDAEVREFYRQRGFETRARLLVVGDRATAERALQDIRAGKEFGQVADRYSLRGMVPPGGDIGYVAPGTFTDPIDDDVRQRPSGWLSDPVAVPGVGFLVVQVLERRPRVQPAFESEAGQLSDILRQRKQRVLALRILDELREDYGVQLVPGAPQFLFQKFTSLRAPSFLGQDVRPTMPEFTDEELARPVATWRDGSYTMRQALDDLEQAPQKPSLAMLPEIEEFLRGYALQHVALQEARRRGLHLRSDVSVMLTERADDWLIQRVYEREVVPRAAVDPELLQRIYGRRQLQYSEVSEAVLRYVETGDSTLAARVASQAAGAADDFGERARRWGAVLREERVDLARRPGRWADLGPMFLELSPGQIAGPLPTAEGTWMVLELVSRRVHTPTFEELDAFAQSQLMSEALDEARQGMFRSLADSLRRATPTVQVNHERLRRLPWPPPRTTPDPTRS
jgi:hypothetical protein